jgi:photosystem II stability/assembly factor-like uncharacterized protein
MKTNVKLLLVILLLTIVKNLSAQWEMTSGPPSANVLTECISGPNLFSGASGFVYLTTNNGDTWTLASNGLNGSTVSALAVSGSTIYAAAGNSVFQSPDNGLNWINTSYGLPGYNVNSLTVNNGNIYAGTFGVYLSTNNGLTWNKISNGWNAMVTSVAVRGDTILAATLTDGIHMSLDNGNTWCTINSGLPSQVNSVFIYGSIFLSGTNYGLYRSIDNGNYWSSTNLTAATGQIVAIGINIFAAGNQDGGVFSSINEGYTWSAINLGLTNLTVFSLAIGDIYLFAGTSGYVWRRLLSEIVVNIENNSKYDEVRIYQDDITSQIIIISRYSNSFKLHIYDITGRRITSTNIDKEIKFIDKNNLISGIYLFQFIDYNEQNRIITKTLLIK